LRAPGWRGPLPAWGGAHPYHARRADLRAAARARGPRGAIADALRSLLRDAGAPAHGDPSGVRLRAAPRWPHREPAPDEGRPGEARGKAREGGREHRPDRPMPPGGAGGPATGPQGPPVLSD